MIHEDYFCLCLSCPLPAGGMGWVGLGWGRFSCAQVRVDSLSFRRAFLEGYLLPHEYAACYGFASCVALTVLMGLLLSREEPEWAGHVLWTGMLVLMFTFLPAAKWFGTYQVGGWMRSDLFRVWKLLAFSHGCVCVPQGRRCV